jgi:hypothetical protein
MRDDALCKAAIPASEERQTLGHLERETRARNMKQVSRFIARFMRKRDEFVSSDSAHASSSIAGRQTLRAAYSSVREWRGRAGLDPVARCRVNSQISMGTRATRQ